MTKERLQMYRNWIIYQVYPKSFADSNGDGVGDLRGIISKLDYIKSLSVDAVWISPCYPSPGDDNGYDVSDYTDIAPEYGSMQDMDELIAKAHAMDIKIILDLVANHTSSNHAWFRASRQSKTNAYADYYYWADQPLNEWKSIFTGKSAWIYDEGRKQYYLANFAPSQPDLNWENPKVRRAIEEVVDFWIARGVDGFRCDVLDMISKEMDKPDGCGNGRRLHEYIRGLFNRKSTEGIFTVGECWSTDIDNMQRFCGLGRGELSCSFQDDHRRFGYDFKDKFLRTEYELRDVAAVLSKWQRATLDGDILYTLFWENHDSARIISRFGDEKKRYASGTMLATMLYLLSGVCFLYQGQELGLVNTNFQELSAFDDIESLQYFKNNEGKISRAELFKRLNFIGRDNGRRMMPWTDKKVPAWIATDERQLAFNVEAQEKDEGSILAFYRRLLAMRKANEIFSEGTYREIALTDGYFIYERALEGRSCVVVCNFDKPSVIEGVTGIVVLSNLNRNVPSGKYAPYECAVVQK